MLTYTVEMFTGADYELVFSSVERETAYGLKPDMFEDAHFIIIKTWLNGIVINQDVVNLESE